MKKFYFNLLSSGVLAMSYMGEAFAIDAKKLTTTVPTNTKLEQGIADSIKTASDVVMPIVWAIAVIIAGYNFFIGNKEDTWKPITAAIFLQVLSFVFTKGLSILGV